MGSPWAVHGSTKTAQAWRQDSTLHFARATLLLPRRNSVAPCLPRCSSSVFGAGEGSCPGWGRLGLMSHLQGSLSRELGGKRNLTSLRNSQRWKWKTLRSQKEC